MVEKKHYILKDKKVYFNDTVLIIDGTDFQRKDILFASLGEKITTFGENVFEGNQLHYISFHKKVKYIHSKAFANNQIEKIVFERVEIPEISKDAFENNPVKLIIIPYESKEAYCTLLSQIDLPEDVIIKTNIEVAFERAEELKHEGSLLYICVRRVYGDTNWRIEVKDEIDFDSRMRRDQNEQNFSVLKALNDIEYHTHRDSQGNIQIYRRDDAYINLTFDDFRILFEEKSRL